MCIERNVFAGTNSADGFVWLLNNGGQNVGYSFVFGSNQMDMVQSVAQTPDGGYILVGSTYNGTNYDALIVKLDASFAKTWSTSLTQIDDAGTAAIDESAQNEWGNSVAQTASGSYLVCGTIYNATSGMTELAVWEKKTSKHHCNA